MKEDMWMDDNIKYQSNQSKAQKLTLFKRSDGLVTGVKDVLSFDAKEILLDTQLGLLMIRGEDLHVTKLTVEKGEVALEGRVDSLVYSDQKIAEESGHFLQKLFK